MDGQKLALQGIERSFRRQRRADPYWSEAAYLLLLRYVDEHPCGLTIELIRKFAESQGLRDPISVGAWGQVVQRAIRNHVIRFAGYETSSNPSRHSSPVRIWRRA